jgi:hypothetical protein
LKDGLHAKNQKIAALENKHILVLCDSMNQVYRGLKDCGKKIVSATKFIDYFVHDMLDYTVLNQDDSKFTRTLTVFDVRDAINEIIEILQDKISMKNIKCEIEYLNFNSL